MVVTKNGVMILSSRCLFLRAVLDSILRTSTVVSLLSFRLKGHFGGFIPTMHATGIKS